MNNALIGNSNLLDLDQDLDSNDVGKLTSTNRIQLNTAQAKRLFNGHVSQHKNSMAFGIKQIGYNMNMMMVSIRGDDPYGDYYFYEIESRLAESREKTRELASYFKSRAEDAIPTGFVISKATSMKPTVIDIRSSNPLFFQMVFWLCELDEFITLITSLKHIGILTPKVASDTIAREENAFRSITHFIRSYQVTGVTRDDFAANNARVTQAKERMKHIILPDEILTGELRSEYAPNVQKNEAEVITVKNAAGDNDDAASPQDPKVDSKNTNNVKDSELVTENTQEAPL